MGHTNGSARLATSSKEARVPTILAINLVLLRDVVTRDLRPISVERETHYRVSANNCNDEYIEYIYQSVEFRNDCATIANENSERALVH